MFLLDDVLLAPGKAAFVLFQELARKAQEEWLNDDVVKQELQQLYEMLESGRITDKDFEAQECRLLERLEQIARIKFQDKWGTEVPVADAPAVEQPVVEQQVVVSALNALPPMSPQMQTLPPLTASPQPVIDMQPPSASAPSFASPTLFTSPSFASPPPLPAPPPPAPASFAPPAPASFASSVVNPFVAAYTPAAQPAYPPGYVPLAPSVQPPQMQVPAGGALTMNQVIDCAIRALAVLKMRVSTITSVMPEEDNWRVSVELVERRGIPDTNDVLGLYELRLDRLGNVLRYERTQMRRRCDFSR
jgi:Gas vesicle synthesis protein GvpO/Gas vesicle protein G